MGGEMMEGMHVHGGDWRRLSAERGRKPEDILDFSVNVRPEGAPDWLRGVLLRGLDVLGRYPSPRGEEACEAAGAFHGIPAECVVFGDGCNGLIHSLPFLARDREVLLVQPAFSEYEAACRKAGLAVRHFMTHSEDGFVPDWESLKTAAPAGGMVWLASPGNPTGVLLAPERMREAAEQRPDVLWVLDEAFIDYAGEDSSLVSEAARRENLIVLRSLTKFYGLAGLRCGYAVTGRKFAALWRAFLPAWCLNILAASAACAVFADAGGFASAERVRNAARRGALSDALKTLPDVDVMDSAANYILLRLRSGFRASALHCLRAHGVVLRDCSNYRGLEFGGWYRAAVRDEESNAVLVDVLREAAGKRLAPAVLPRRRRPALMLQGTCSDAGKSVLAAAFCRILLQDGYDVAPFKAQNMALNSGVTALGEEMGRAQMVQAAACRLDPDVRMNPVLLKPHSDCGSQVVMLGRSVGHLDASGFTRAKARLWPTVCQAYDELSSEHEAMVLEGAGSPGEVNLKHADIVNMNMARYADARVLLVGDIDRGGCYASLLGTWLTFSPEEKRLLCGFLVNKFRGDASLLAPAHDYIFSMTGTPVAGVVPMLRDLRLPEEDRSSFSFEDALETRPDALDIAVVMPGHVSNYTDFAPLAAEPDVRLRAVRSAGDFGAPHCVILPGSKSVVCDFLSMRESGLAALVAEHARAGKWTLGICGGLQMMGQAVHDPYQVESGHVHAPMLGLLDFETTMQCGKTLALAERVRTPLGVPTNGYEIHHGETAAGKGCRPLFFKTDGTPCGFGADRMWATYLHGIFDDDAFRRAFIDRVRLDSGLEPAGRVLAEYNLEASIDRLADAVRSAVNLRIVYRSMGLA